MGKDLLKRAVVIHFLAVMVFGLISGASLVTAESLPGAFKDPYNGAGKKLPAGGGEPGKAYMAFVEAAYNNDYAKICELLAGPGELAPCLEHKETVGTQWAAWFASPESYMVKGGFMKEEEATLDVAYTSPYGTGNSYVVMKQKNGKWIISSFGGSSSGSAMTVEAGGTVDLTDGSKTSSVRVEQLSDFKNTGPLPGKWSFKGKDSKGLIWKGGIEIRERDPDPDYTDAVGTFVCIYDRESGNTYNGGEATCEWDQAKRQISFNYYTAILSANRKVMTRGTWKQEEMDWDLKKMKTVTGTWSATHADAPDSEEQHDTAGSTDTAVKAPSSSPTGPASRFTVGNGARAGTVTDTAAGLVWQQCAAGLSGPNCTAGAANTFSEPDAERYCASLSLGGYGAGAWRLPNIKELQTLIDYGRSGPAIDPAFPGMPPRFFFWSSTSSSSNASSAWGVNFDVVFVTAAGKASGNFPSVRCVHPVSKAVQSAQREQNFSSGSGSRSGTVTDISTGLTWQKCAAGLSGANCETGTPSVFTTQQEAAGYCNSLNLGSWSAGWRLPSVVELLSIVDYARQDPANDVKLFPNTPAKLFRSSSARSGSASSAWVVSFRMGFTGIDSDYAGNSSVNDFRVRCVR